MSQSRSAGQAPSNNALFPIIAQDPSRWIGPFGGTVVSIAIDPVHPQFAYAGSFGSGVYKSTDGGSTWVSGSQGLDNLFVYSLAIDPSHPSILYAGSYRSQVYKSVDGGNSWVWSGSGMQDQAIVYSLAVDPVNTAIIYAATRGISNDGNPPWNGVLYRSTNGGLTWSAILQDLGGPLLQDWAYSITVSPYDHSQVLIAAHETGPHRSDNYGIDWYSIDNGVQDFSGRSIVISPEAEHSSTYYYGVWHEDTIYKSIDAAVSWWPINQGYTYQHVYSIALDPQNVNNIFLGTFVNGILKSTDGGASWVPSGLAVNDVYSVVVNPATPSHLSAGTAGDGVFQSTDSGTGWSHSSAGIDNANVTAVIPSPTVSGRIYASLYGGGVYLLPSLGASWQEINKGLTDQFVLDLVIDPGHPGLAYALTDTGLFKNDFNTSNGWFPAGIGLPLTNYILPAYSSDHPFATLDMKEAFANQRETLTNRPSTTVPLTKMVYASSNPQIAYIGTAGAGVYRSSDGGQTWLPAGLASESINSLAVDQTDPSLVYAATREYGSLKVSTTAGNSWFNVSLPVTFYSLEASPTAPGVLYAGTSNGIYRLQSGTFTSLGLDEQTVTAIRLDPAHPGEIFSGTDQTAYYSLDGGASWISVNDQLQDQTIQAISIDPIDHNEVYFSTKTHGIFLVAR